MRRVWILIVLGCTLLAAALRLYRLGAASFWVDECNTVRATMMLPEVNRSKVLGYVPTAMGLRLFGVPLKRELADQIHRWQALGISEFRTRLASCLIGILSVPLLTLASRRLLGPRAAAWLGLLLAIAPWHIYWSQAARFYTQQFLFYNLALIAYFVATAERRRGLLAAAMACVLLAFLSQPPALVIVGVFAIDWLAGWLRGEPVRLGRFGWAAGAVMLGLCAAALGLDMLQRTEQWTQFVHDQYQTPAKILLGTAYMTTPAVVLLALMTVLTRDEAPRRRLYLLAAALLPPLAFAGISLVAYVGLRYAFVSLYAWLALAALGIERVETLLARQGCRVLAWAPGLVIAAVLAMFDYGYYTAGYGFHPRWREAFAYVREHRQAGQAVATHQHVGFYYLQDAGVRLFPRSPDQLATLTRPTWIVVEVSDAIGGHRHVWLDDYADLRAYYDTRVIQPVSSVRVYYYQPR